MLKGKNPEDTNREDIWTALNKVSMDLLDPYRDYEEINPATPNVSYGDSFYANEENLDEFDWTGIKFEDSSQLDLDYEVVENNYEEKMPDWDELINYMETAATQGCFWDATPEEYGLTPQVNAIRSNSFQSNRRETKQDVNRLMRQFDRLPANGVDIFCLDDRVFDASYKIVSNFEMNVPLKIYSQDEEFVIKADLPDIVINNDRAGVVFPEKLNFKSVLALLPDRINTRQLKPSFIDGQFRLELPKRQEQKSKKIK